LTEVGLEDLSHCSTGKIRLVTRQIYGKCDPKYHIWLYKHMGNIRNVCGEDSDEAYNLAIEITTELSGEEVQELRLYPECWVSMSQFDRRMFEMGGGTCRFRENLSIYQLHE
jgi:hypothetical protein